MKTFAYIGFLVYTSHKEEICRKETNYFPLELTHRILVVNM